MWWRLVKNDKNDMMLHKEKDREIDLAVARIRTRRPLWTGAISPGRFFQHVPAQWTSMFPVLTLLLYGCVFVGAAFFGLA